MRELGYPDSFVRLWEFYLCYCEGGFAERQLGAVQMLLTKPALPATPAWVPGEESGECRVMIARRDSRETWRAPACDS